MLVCLQVHKLNNFPGGHFYRGRNIFRVVDALESHGHTFFRCLPARKNLSQNGRF